MSIVQNKVLIIGLGATGSNLALMLSKNPNIEVVGLDFDHVENKNTAVSLVYSSRHIGMRKIDVIRRELNIACLSREITTIEDLERLNLDQFSHIVLCLDNRKTRNLIWYYLLSKNEMPAKMIDLGIGDHFTSDIRYNFTKDKIAKLLVTRDIDRKVIKEMNDEMFLKINNELEEVVKNEVCGNSTSLQINVFTTSYLYNLISTGFDQENIMFDINLERDPEYQIMPMTY